MVFGQSHIFICPILKFDEEKAEHKYWGLSEEHKGIEWCKDVSLGLMIGYWLSDKKLVGRLLNNWW